MAQHLGHAKNEAVTNPAGNTRNGKSKKTLTGVGGQRFQTGSLTAVFIYGC
jgi:putative transposase